MTQVRQLAAIMFTDIVGYTSLMGEDEKKAFDLMNDNRLFQKSIIEEYGGKLIKEMGDGIMASFPAVTDAVQAALKIHNESCLRNIQLRIGLHFGDILFENNDIYGDAVNIASRIQSLGVPGSVLFSKRINDEISNKNLFKAISLGVFELKNVKNPIEVFALANEGFVLSKPGQLKGKLKKQRSLLSLWVFLLSLLIVAAVIFGYKKFNKKSDFEIQNKSIAVLPFVNMSGDPKQEYFSDGLSEELINMFTRLPELKVIGRTSSFAFKGKNEDLRSIGEKLNVDYLLEGSVRNSNNKMRITTQLIKANDGTHLWSDTYNMNMNDVFAVQEQISASVTEVLRVTFSRNSNVKLANVNPEAYNDFLQGRYLYEKSEEPLNRGEAMKWFKEAIRKDSTFSLPWTYLSMCLLTDVISSDEVKFEQSKQAAYKAFELDSTSGIAAINVAEIMDRSYNFIGAKEKVDLALALEPEVPYVLRNAGRFYTIIGKKFESETYSQRAVEKDPIQIKTLEYLALAYFYGGKYEEFRKINRRMSELNYPPFDYENFLSYLFENIISKAKYTIDSLHGQRLKDYATIYLFASPVNKSDAENNIMKLKVDYNESKDLSMNIAETYTRIGEFDKAVEWLEIAYKDKIHYLEYLKVDPAFYALKNHPGFKSLIKKMNYPD